MQYVFQIKNGMISDDSKILCVEIISNMVFVSTKVTNTIATNLSINSHS